MSSNPDSSDFNYKDYSLEKLQEWIHDAMNSDASPHEIYSAIRETVREDYQYHKDAASRALGLLELLSGHRPVADNSKYDAWEEYYYPEEYKESVNLDKELEEIRKQGGYDWTPEPAKKKWVLPVEQFAGSEEYLISFPDDLLEAANLKEGDEVEWVDQGDGSYLLKKVENSSWVKGSEESKHKTYQEMVADGWSMTDDGFWIKE